MPASYCDKLLATSNEISDCFAVSIDGQEVETRFRTLPQPIRSEALRTWTGHFFHATQNYHPDHYFAVVHFPEHKLLLMNHERHYLGVITRKNTSEGDLAKKIFIMLGKPLPNSQPKSASGASKDTPFVMELKPTPPVVAGKSQPPPKAVPPPKKSGPWLALAIVGVVAAGALAYFFLSPASPPATPSPDLAQPAPAPAPVPAPTVAAPAQPATSAPDATAPASSQTEDWPTRIASLTEQYNAIFAAAQEMPEAAQDKLARAQTAQSAARQAQEQGQLEHAVGLLADSVNWSGEAVAMAFQKSVQAALQTVPVENAAEFPSQAYESLTASLAKANTLTEERRWVESIVAWRATQDAIQPWKTDLAVQISKLARAASAKQNNNTATYFYKQLLALDPKNEEATSFIYRNVFKPGQIVENSINMKLAYIPPGVFQQGTPASEPLRDSDEMEHRVTLTKGFFMGVCEVTQEQWRQVMGDPSPWVTAENQQGSGFVGSNLPMHGVSWKEANVFCRKISEIEGKVYRLPTEAEWEYACRAGTTTSYANGRNDLKNEEANVTDPYMPRESPIVVGMTSLVNAWGLKDMHGNIWEWCSDWSASYPEWPVTDPIGPTDQEAGRIDLAMKIVRGGGWNDDASKARSGNRWEYSPAVATNYIGFRVVLEASVNDLPRGQ